MESLIFVTPEPIPESTISRVAGIKKTEIFPIIEQLNNAYQETGRTFRIKKLAGGYSFYSLPEYSDFLGEAFPDRKYPHLTRTVIEVLAVIAMEQPVTKKHIEKIRGTRCDQQVKTLMQLGFITPVSRLEAPGRPYLLGTTQKFLKHFGLSRIEDIPTIDELKDLLD